MGGVEIETIDFAYDPCDITIPANTPVTFTLRNKGLAVHGFVVDALDISERTLPGETATVVVSAPVGVYEFYSDVPGHRQGGMVGRLTVVEGAPVSSAAGSSTIGTPDSAPDAPPLGAFLVTLEPGAVLTALPGTNDGPISVHVQSGGPATFALGGPATVIRPVGEPSTFPENGGRADFGPLVGIVIPPTTGYELRNGGQEPLVLLWVAGAASVATAASAGPVPEGPGVSVTPLLPPGPDAAATPVP